MRSIKGILIMGMVAMITVPFVYTDFQEDLLAGIKRLNIEKVKQALHAGALIDKIVLQEANKQVKTYQKYRIIAPLSTVGAGIIGTINSIIFGKHWYETQQEVNKVEKELYPWLKQLTERDAVQWSSIKEKYETHYEKIPASAFIHKDECPKLQQLGYFADGKFFAGTYDARKFPQYYWHICRRNDVTDDWDIARIKANPDAYLDYRMRLYRHEIAEKLLLRMSHSPNEFADLLVLEALVTIDANGKEQFNKDGVFKRVFFAPFIASSNESTFKKMMYGTLIGGGAVVAAGVAGITWTIVGYKKYQRACAIKKILEENRSVNNKISQKAGRFYLSKMY